MKTYVQQIMLGSVTSNEARSRETLQKIKAAGSQYSFTLKSKKTHKYLFFQSKIYNFAASYLILSANG